MRTERDNLYVVLGGPKPGIFRKLPFLSPAASDPFPIAVCVLNTEEAKEVDHLNTLIVDFAGESPWQTAWALWRNDIVRSTLAHWIQKPCAVWNTNCIYPSWDYARNVISGKIFVKFRSPGSFQLCLIYLVLKADRDVFIRWLEEAGLPIPPQKVHFPQNVPDTPKKVVQALPRFSTTPATPTKTLVGSRPSYTTPTKPSSRQTTSVDMLAKPVKLQMLPTQKTSRAEIYQYIRTLEGITGVLTEPPIHNASDELPFRDLGDLVEDYLISHGYDAASNREIHYAFELSDNVGEFTVHLSQRGMAVTEAKWLWVLIIRSATDSSVN